MALLGILFDIDELGGGFYGKEAYKLFFSTIGAELLRDVELFDGDTQATLSGRARHYCVALSADESLMEVVRDRLLASDAVGFLPRAERFCPEAAVRHEMLVFAGRIDKHGNLLNCTTPWVEAMWLEAIRQVAHMPRESDLAWAWRRLYAP